MPRFVKNSLLLNILLIIFTAVVGYSSFSMVRSAIGLYKENSESEAKIRELLAKGDDLDARISEFRTPLGLEREAKERLNLKQRGEEVVVVLPGRNSGVATTSSGFWQKLWVFLDF
ncbi:MAG: hypothetical protein HYW91_01765 [Candidatus Sungbacteria bacterium]|nr:hypothetical protein [Candidatus Sungbacteria bacterium]